jgi:multisubunit Na+/H+ antiporter MnhF subunit
VNDIVFYVALVWMLVLLVATLVVVIRADGTLTRLLALDTLTLVLTALLVLYSAMMGRSYYLDVAIMLTLLSFMSTVAVARYHAVEEPQ